MTRWLAIGFGAGVGCVATFLGLLGGLLLVLDRKDRRGRVVREAERITKGAAK